MPGEQQTGADGSEGEYRRVNQGTFMTDAQKRAAVIEQAWHPDYVSSIKFKEIRTLCQEAGIPVEQVGDKQGYFLNSAQGLTDSATTLYFATEGQQIAILKQTSQNANFRYW